MSSLDRSDGQSLSGLVGDAEGGAVFDDDRLAPPSDTIIFPPEVDTL